MTTPKTVSEILVAYLKAERYDGLYSEVGGCACVIAHLVLCERAPMGCSPGHRVKCNCGDHDYHIVAGRRRRP